MASCVHGKGGFCGPCEICKVPTKSCCGDGYCCDKCESEFCRNCERKYTIDEDFCPVCNHLVVSTEQVIDYLLDKVSMNRKQVEDQIRKLPVEIAEEERCYECDGNEGICIQCNGCSRVFHPGCMGNDGTLHIAQFYCMRCTMIKNPHLREHSPKRK